MATSMMSAPTDDALAQAPIAGCAAHEAPMILQVSPLPGTSDPEEFFYDPFANIKGRDFVAVWAFFIHNGYTVVYHASSNTMAFQELLPSASICYL
jgi:hypothetical protein